MALKNLAKTQNEISFRQTFNQYSMNWTAPKRQKGNKWVPIDKKRLACVVTKKDGYRFALWRMRLIMLDIKDEHGHKVWKVHKISKQPVTIKGVPYSMFHFSCYRVTQGIIGGMDNTGGI